MRKPQVTGQLLFMFAMLMQALPLEAREAQPLLHINSVSGAPSLRAFNGLEVPESVRREFTKAEGFLQREPKDGKPSSERTKAYLGYDRKNLYVLFVCWDSQPTK